MRVKNVEPVRKTCVIFAIMFGYAYWYQFLYVYTWLLVFFPRRILNHFVKLQNNIVLFIGKKYLPRPRIGRMWENMNSYTLLVGVQFGTYTVESNLAVSGKSEEKNIPQARDGEVLDTYLRETHVFTRKQITYFTAALFIITKNSK